MFLQGSFCGAEYLKHMIQTVLYLRQPGIAGGASMNGFKQLAVQAKDFLMPLFNLP